MKKDGNSPLFCQTLQLEMLRSAGLI